MQHLTVRVSSNIESHIEAQSKKLGKKYSEMAREYLELASILIDAANEQNIDPRSLILLSKKASKHEKILTGSASECVMLLRNMAREMFSDVEGKGDAIIRKSQEESTVAINKYLDNA